MIRFCSLLFLLATPALADPALGIGVSFIFGGDTAIGLRVFSDDEPEEFVASIGVDYVIGAQRVRPTIGAAYLDDSIYFGLDMGYDFNRGALDFSVGIGAVDTNEPAAAASPAPAPAPAPAPSGEEEPVAIFGEL